MADRGEEDRAPVPRRAAACSMHQVLPDLTSQVAAAGPSADPAADPVAEGATGTTRPTASAAAGDDPPDA